MFGGGVVEVPLVPPRKDPKSVAHIPRCPDASWIDDRNVSTHEDHGSKQVMVPVNAHLWP